nr:hypothetical protein [Streptomyces yerevanensis]
MGTDRLLHRFGEVAQQVPGVRRLPGLGSPAPGTFGVSAGPVRADHLDFRMAAQPVGERVGVPARQHIDRATSFQVHQDRGVRVALAQREVVDPKDPHAELW